MSNYTAELRTILDNGFEIFDFEYTRDPRSVLLLTKKDLEQGFIDRYYFREVGFETLERFKHKLKTQWLESIWAFDKKLIAYASEINPTTNLGSEVKTSTILNDTPKNALDFGEQSTHASSTAYNTQSTSGYAGTTQIELLELYTEKLHDIQSEFYDSFDNLFMQVF